MTRPHPRIIVPPGNDRREAALEYLWFERLAAWSGDPAMLLTGLFLLSLFADSAAAIVAALLVARGLLPMGMAAIAIPTFLIIGDGALYFFGLLARESRFLARFIPLAKITHAESWLRARRTLVLAISRVLPGSRSIVFVGFGYLRMPAAHFFMVNAVGAAVWSFTLMGFVAFSAVWFEDAGLWPSMAAGLMAAAVILLPSFLVAARSGLQARLRSFRKD